MQAFIQLLSYKLRSKGKKLLLVLHYKNKRENYHCVIIFNTSISLHSEHAACNRQRSVASFETSRIGLPPIFNH